MKQPLLKFGSTFAEKSVLVKGNFNFLMLILFAHTTRYAFFVFLEAFKLRIKPTIMKALMFLRKNLLC